MSQLTLNRLVSAAARDAKKPELIEATARGMVTAAFPGRVVATLKLKFLSH